MTKLPVVVDPESIVIPKKPANKSASEHRKITKPIMEKKRRARINHSLEQIKDILKENFNECNRKQNIEKADILEMTVKYLKLVTKNSSKKLPLSLDQSNNVQLIENGFKDCKQQINQCLSKINPKINERLNNHLNKFQKEQISSMDCDQVLNLSLNDHMIMNNSFMLHTPNSASSTNSYQTIFFPNSPVSERSLSPLCLTVQSNSIWRPW